ncbi:DUF4190 domain-containing protein [Streptomyces sp. NPDC005805]|uniref:DUF4190 domain-containing protein n=1 Tax=Streptomyces sp. NPDC005805 TaxID=3157068 RepID=UPI0033EE874C
MTLLTPFAKPEVERDPATSAGTAPEAAPHREQHAPADAPERKDALPAAARRKDADGMAVAAFVLGLVGLLVMNLVLGPTAVVLGALALLRGTARRGRALLGLALGVADLVVLAVVVTAGGSVVWGFGS